MVQLMSTTELPHPVCTQNYASLGSAVDNSFVFFQFLFFFCFRMFFSSQWSTTAKPRNVLHIQTNLKSCTFTHLWKKWSRLNFRKTTRLPHAGNHCMCSRKDNFFSKRWSRLCSQHFDECQILHNGYALKDPKYFFCGTIMDKGNRILDRL